MNNFIFYNPTVIVFGKDRLHELTNYIPAGSKVLITYGGGSVIKSGTLQKVKDALQTNTVLEFGGIEPNPRFETLMKAVELIKKENATFLLAVGGGSVMDGTKFISLAVKYNGNPEDILYHGFKPVDLKEAMPLGNVVTLPATGSEMNIAGVISYKKGKYGVLSPLTFPKFSFLDPTLTYTLPETQVANGVVDTFVHVMEQYLTFPVEARFQDRTAEGILQTLIEIGRKTIDNPQDYDARANLVWCSTMALNGLIGAGVPQDWATHMIGHELTASFGIDHAKTLAIIMPALLEVRFEQKKSKLVQYAERVWKIENGNDDEKATLAISKTREFFESLGVKTRLTDYGVTQFAFDDILTGLEEKKLTALSETRDVTLDISRLILEKAL
ncbi:MAG: NADP-dependent alcohol dehydrogenase [Ignavibacteria bacterium]|nr:MAG: NADP-dependent alcohol dehydrogenase [Ignavibacteria bacterium]KAF0161390.1 MAG: NADP-dependent alcohol dehydrogenase [Ignavibacteria bacterium]